MSALSSSGCGRHPRSCRKNKLGELSQVLGGCCQQKLILSPAWTAQPQTPHPQNALEMGKQHLDALATLPRPLKGRRARQ
jgi:hypothetical protein